MGTGSYSTDIAQPQLTLENAEKWVTAEISLLDEGPVPITVFNQRLDQCVVCEQRTGYTQDKLGFCQKCSCGENIRAKLETKLNMPKAECPLGKWGFAAGEGRHAIDRIGGYGKQIKEQAQQMMGTFWDAIKSKLKLDDY